MTLLADYLAAVIEFLPRQPSLTGQDFGNAHLLPIFHIRPPCLRELKGRHGETESSRWFPHLLSTRRRNNQMYPRRPRHGRFPTRVSCRAFWQSATKRHFVSWASATAAPREASGGSRLVCSRRGGAAGRPALADRPGPLVSPPAVSGSGSPPAPPGAGDRFPVRRRGWYCSICFISFPTSSSATGSGTRRRCWRSRCC
jgi:hypothetical protein